MSGETIESRQNVEWEIAKYLLDAHNQTGQALEQYLILQTLREEPPNGGDSIESAIDSAIKNHEQIINTLKEARETIGELSD